MRRVKCLVTAAVWLGAGTSAAALAQGAPTDLVPAQIGAPTVQTPATPPVAVPAPVPVPQVTIPPLSPLQEARLNAWLGLDAEQGLARVPGRARSLTGEALVRAVLDRARTLRTGRLAAVDFLEDWAMRPAPFDPAPGLAEAVVNDRIEGWLAQLTPPYAGYEGLRKGLATYRGIKAAGGWSAVPGGPEMSLGARGPRVAALRKRLAVEDREIGPGDVFDAATVAAVQRAQKRYGLNPTGILGPQTLASLNVPVEDRIGAIMANMERWRWLPRSLPTHRVQVNVAAAILTVFEGDKPVQSMRAVTGAPDSATPMLASQIHSIVINPPWNVPRGIAERELFPKGAAYLSRNGFKVITNPDGSKRLQQAAGDLSALGRLKFDFDNPFAVYLHDTPSRGKFASYDRLASHGCVRLEKPRDLAARMLAGDPKWTPETIGEAITTGKTQRVALPEKVAVYLLYWTAFAGQNGQMNFREDPYGWDKVLAGKVDASQARSVAVARRD